MPKSLNERFSKTEVVETEWEGLPMFEICGFIEKGGKTYAVSKHIIKLGVIKAQALVKHLEELKAFVAKNI